jgi:hypothetical protein
LGEQAQGRILGSGAASNLGDFLLVQRLHKCLFRLWVEGKMTVHLDR